MLDEESATFSLAAKVEGDGRREEPQMGAHM